MFYTHKERTEKKYTRNQMADTALLIIKDKSKGKLTQVCTDTLKGVSDTDLFTIEEMNEFVYRMIGDTFYYDGWKMNV